MPPPLYHIPLFKICNCIDASMYHNQAHHSIPATCVTAMAQIEALASANAPASMVMF